MWSFLRIPQNSVDDDVKFSDFFSEQFLCLAVIDFDLCAEHAQKFQGSPRDISSSEKRHFAVVGHLSPALESVHDRRFACKFIVAVINCSISECKVGTVAVSNRHIKTKTISMVFSAGGVFHLINTHHFLFF